MWREVLKFLMAAVVGYLVGGLVLGLFFTLVLMELPESWEWKLQVRRCLVRRRRGLGNVLGGRVDLVARQAAQ